MSLMTEIPLQIATIMKRSTSGIFVAWSTVIFLGFVCIFLSTEDLRISRMFHRHLIVISVDAVFVLISFLFIVAVVCILAYEFIYWRNYIYDIEENNIYIAKGVFVKRKITIPINKITDVYIDQDTLDKSFKLYDVHILTSINNSSQFAHIDGLSEVGSKKVKEMIMGRIKKNS